MSGDQTTPEEEALIIVKALEKVLDRQRDGDR